MTRRTKRPESSLNKFLHESMTRNKKFRALFLADVRSHEPSKNP